MLSKDSSERRDEICVIGTNAYFDMIVDNRIMAGNPLLGKYIKKITVVGKLNRLNAAIEEDPILNKSGNSEAVPSRNPGRRKRSLLQLADIEVQAPTNDICQSVCMKMK